MIESRRHHRLLIVSPSFHDYDQAFRRAFAALGFEVAVCTYDALPTMRHKIRNKLIYELPEKAGKDTMPRRVQAATAKALQAVRDVNPDRVLVVRGDTLGSDFRSALAERRIPNTTWFYDEFARMRYLRQDLDMLPAIASYSQRDTADFLDHGLNAIHVPLGFDHLAPIHRHNLAREVTFIGARYANREAMLTALAASNVPVRVFGRDWSHDWRDRLRTWSIARPDLESGRDLARGDAYGVMAGSLATLNMHFRQDGFTMRTFEAAGVGAVQLIDREDVTGLYEPNAEVLVFSSPAEAADHAERLARDPALGQRIRTAARCRTLASHTLVHRARILAAHMDDTQ